MAGNTVKLTFIGDSRSLDRTLRGVGGGLDGLDRKGSGALGRLGSGFASFGTAAAAGLATAGVAAFALGKTLISAAEEAQQVSRQTAAVIKSMGASSWTTADAIENLASKISLKTGLDDEMIQSGENVLLTFRNVRNEVGLGNDIFDRATRAATDMSVALGQDMQSSAVQLGKALNDPIAGLSALSRVGVQFTEDQKAMIEGMVASGDVMGAQKIILGELEAQFSGSAEAQATASAKIKTAFDNIIETLGTYLLPYFERLSTWLVEEGIPKFDQFAADIEENVLPKVDQFVVWIQEDLMPALGQMWDFISNEIIPVYQDIAKTIRDDLLPELGQLSGAIGGLTGALSGNRDQAGKTGDTWGWLADVFAASVWGPQQVWKALSAIVDVLGSIVGAAKDAIDWLNRIKPPSFAGKKGISVGDIIGVSPISSAWRAITGRAVGGPVSAGRGYIVGEDGPEWFSPSTSGTIIPNGGGGRGALAMAGAPVVNVYVQGSIRSDRDLVKVIRDEFDRGGFR